MNKRIYALALVFIIAGLVLSACTRSATTKAPGLATSTSEIPFPVGTVDTSARITEIVQMTQAAGLPTPFPTVAPTQAQVQPTAIVIATTAPTAQVVVPTTKPVVIPTATRPTSYTLQSGEWPICIARRYNLDLPTFLEANGLEMESRPAAGTVLKIPTSGTWGLGERALKAHPTTYNVLSGDSIYSISCDFGDVDPQAIVAANNLQSPYTLTAGQTLQIP